VIHLDTNFAIGVLKGWAKEDAAVRRWLAGGELLVLSAIAWAELLCGPISPAAIDMTRAVIGQIEDFTAADAALAATFFEAGGRRKLSLPDCMIAATAIRMNASLATNNVTDFRAFQAFGLQLVCA
jgi:predicted nucleic acid-binding protein